MASITPAAHGWPVLREVARAYGVTPDELRARGRQAGLVEARRVAMQLLHERGLGHGAVARLLRRDRSTVYHHLARIQTHPSPEELTMLALLRQAAAIPPAQPPHGAHRGCR